jgi:hypothetical protein
MRISVLAPLSAILTADLASAQCPAATCFLPTLRAKSILDLSGLIAFAVISALYAPHERGKFLHIVQQLEHVHERHESLTKINTGLTHAIVSMQKSLKSGNIESPHDDLPLDLASFSPSLPALQASNPATAQIVGRLRAHIAEIGNGPSLNAMIPLRDSDQKLAAQLETPENGVERRGER